MQEWLQKSLETFHFADSAVPYVDIASLSTKIGLDWPSERARLIQDDHWEYREYRLGDDEDSRLQCGLPAAKFMVWLKTVDVAQVRPELRQPLSEYQEQSRQMTRQAFLKSDLLAFARAKDPSRRSPLENKLIEAAEILLAQQQDED